MKLYERLQQADKEKLVEEAYHQELQEALKRNGNKVLSLQIENNTDGILEAEYYKGEEMLPHILKVIIETKLQEGFESTITRSKVLLQVVCYLKKQEDLGRTPPNIVFIGDKDECFILHTRYLQKYIQMNILGTNSPSTAFQKNPMILKEMSEDIDLQEQCYVYSVDKDFDLLTVVEKMLALVRDIKLIVPITEKSISKIFEYFTMRILKRNAKGETKYTPRMQVELFMELLLNPDDCFLHTKRKDIAIMDKNQVSVNSDAFRAFTNFYEFNYSLEEKKDFTAIADRLIEDSDRRRKGDFYTPVLWVDEAHKMLSENLGDDWKEEYIVWDCAAGTKNLTRDYDFKRLYSSTLEEHDLVISSKYNKQAGENWAFQYDFLNDDVELFEELRKKKESGQVLTEEDFENSKLYRQASGLIRGMLSGQKVLFFINPPYGTASTYGNAGKTNYKANMATTDINKRMKLDGIGASSQQLYAQFIYRVSKLKELFNTEIRLGMFSPPLYLSGSSFEGLRGYIGNHLEYINGFTFQASEFADVASNWGISFTLLQNKKCQGLFNNFRLGIKTFGVDGIKEVGEKVVYHLDVLPKGSDWIKEDIKGLPTFDSPQMKSALNYDQVPKRGKQVDGSIGYYYNISNIVNNNNQLVYLLSSCQSGGNGSSILPQNFDKVTSNFTARRLITGKYSDWKNWQDEYMIPNVEHSDYQQWENDSIVYSIFNNKSNQSSLRDIDYNNKKWDIYNHFFFMSKQDILDLAQGKLDRSTMNNNVEEDIQNHGKEERYVYEKLQNTTLSPDAQAVLDKARELIVKSFALRDMFNQEHPEYNIETWDAGWYQIKGLLKEYMPEDLKDFTKLYKEFEDRMRPLVYELGFLYK